MQCPKCGYVRRAEDLAPEWQCPACQVAYAKASRSTEMSDYPPPAADPRRAAKQASSGGPSLKTLAILALVAFIGYGAYQFFSKVTITRETPANVDTTSPITAPDKTVLLYSSSGCKYCKQAKEFLNKHNIPYEEIDVYTSERGKADFARLGGIGVPIIIVADTKIIGFDEDELKSVLKAKGLWQ